MPCKLLFLALLAPFVLFIGCGPRFQPRYEMASNCFDHLESVPIIIVARIEPNAVSPAGKPFRDDSVPVGPIRLLKVAVSIEKVLKGSASLGHAAVFYFGAETPSAGAIAFFGRQMFRVILLLRRERGELRMAQDITSACEAGVYSGAHLTFQPRPGEPLREQMIDLLLTPGTGATDIGMVRAIFERCPFEISPEYTARTLVRLAASGTPVVRTAACLGFRDIMVELLGKNPRQGLTLSEQFGLSRSELQRWREQYEQNGWARNWWARPGLTYGRLPSTSLSSDGPKGLSLCTNDEALGVPPLHTR